MTNKNRHSRIKFILSTVVLVVVFASLIFSLLTADTTAARRDLTLDSSTATRHTMRMVEGIEVKQKFVADIGWLDSYWIEFNLEKVETPSGVFIDLRKGDELVKNWEFTTDDIDSIEKLYVDLDTSIELEIGAEYSITISTDETERDNAWSLMYNDENPDMNDRLFINDEPIEGELSYQLAGRTPTPKSEIYVKSAVVTLVAIFFMFMWVVGFTKKGDKVREKFTEVCKKLGEQLFDRMSPVRSFVLAMAIFTIAILGHALAKTMYYKVADRDSLFFLQSQYFSIVFAVVAVPLVGFLFSRLNIWANFWKNTEKPHIMDVVYFGVIFLFMYLSFGHYDITQTAVDGMGLLNLLCEGGNPISYYAEVGGAYQFSTYILFCIWSIPVKIGYSLCGLEPLLAGQIDRVRGFTIWWYKLLPTLFLIASVYIIFKICIKLGTSTNKAKWASLLFFITPMVSFSQFMYGQYDSIGMFFELITVYLLLDRKLLKAALCGGIAVTFKLFPVFIIVPIMLLLEKKIHKVLGYLVVMFSPALFYNILFSVASNTSNDFNSGMVGRLFDKGVESAVGVLPLFMVVLMAVCMFAYFTKTSSRDNFSVQKMMMYIPLIVYSAFFAFVAFHPMWIMILAPYLVINIIINENTTRSLLLTTGANIGFLGVVMAKEGFWTFDADSANYGVWYKIYGIINTSGNGLYRGDAVPRDFATVSTLDGLIPLSAYIALFVTLLSVYLYYTFPSRKNITASRSELTRPFEASRGMVWLYGAVIMLIVVPGMWLYFASAPLS